MSSELSTRCSVSRRSMCLDTAARNSSAAWCALRHALSTALEAIAQQYSSRCPLRLASTAGSQARKRWLRNSLSTVSACSGMEGRSPLARRSNSVVSAGDSLGASRARRICSSVAGVKCAGSRSCSTCQPRVSACPAKSHDRACAFGDWAAVKLVSTEKAVPPDAGQSMGAKPLRHRPQRAGRAG